MTLLIAKECVIRYNDKNDNENENIVRSNN